MEIVSLKTEPLDWSWTIQDVSHYGPFHEFYTLDNSKFSHYEGFKNVYIMN